MLRAKLEPPALKATTPSSQAVSHFLQEDESEKHPDNNNDTQDNQTCSISRPHKKSREKKMAKSAKLNDLTTTLSADIQSNSTKSESQPTAKIAPKKPSTAASKTAWMTKDTDRVLQTIQHDSLQPHDSSISSVGGFDVLCTYNWQIDGKAICVPGSPPRWLPLTLPVTLSPDSGLQYIDRNASHVPQYPFEPAFRALAIMNPDIPLDDTDIIANRNSFRKLLDFAAGKRQDPFRMDLHLINKTLFLSRKERNARMMIHGAANSGYGHNLEKAFTQPAAGLDRSSSHHRVIRYRIGPLTCLVRFEVDGYYDASSEASPPHSEVDNLAASMADLAVKKPTRARAPKPSQTRVLERGTLIPSAKLAEIKAHKTEKINDATPQLWFGRTPYLITGQHKQGVVHTVSCTNVAPRFGAWEEANQERLRKMVSVLVELRNVMNREAVEAAVLVRQEKGGPLRVFGMKRAGSVLPESIVKRHWKEKGSE
ncbi:hypothetical protein ACN47E_006921 [Coniothyrium glycines]